MPGCQVDLRHNMPLRLCGNAISQLQQGSPNSFETANLKIGQRKLGETKLVKSINIDLPFKKKKKKKRLKDWLTSSREHFDNERQSNKIQRHTPKNCWETSNYSQAVQRGRIAAEYFKIYIRELSFRRVQGRVLSSCFESNKVKWKWLVWCNVNNWHHNYEHVSLWWCTRPTVNNPHMLWGRFLKPH